MRPPSARDLAIELGLRDTAQGVERCGHSRWRVTTGAGGARTTMQAMIVDDDWLVAAILHAWCGRSWWPVLQLNARLDGCVRLTSEQGGGLELRAEIFVDGHSPSVLVEDEPSLRDRVSALCRDVLSAGLQIIDARDGETNDAVSAPSSDPGALLRICNDAAWEGHASGSGDVQVTLDTRSALCQATLSLEADGHLRAVVPLTSSATLSAESQNAIARVLLAASSQLRMVKGLVIRQAGGEIAGLSFAGERQPATAATVDCALAALSVACRVVELEVQALQNVDLAREYLAIHCVHPADFVVPALSEQEDMPCLQLP